MQLPVDPARFAAYLSITAVMVATPGPANLFAMALGAHRGRRAVLAGVAGMNLASVAWFAAAGLGLGALALAFPGLFHALAYAGAAYVAWLGLQALWAARRGGLAAAHAPTAAGRSAFRDGFVVQISNPKALLFITVVLPPFIDPARPLGPQILLFAAVGIGGDIATMSAYGFSGAAIARRMREPQFRRAFSDFTGLLLLSAAALIAVRG
jgi:threonine/homoserine/homoserine lactone efflux protein